MRIELGVMALSTANRRGRRPCHVRRLAPARDKIKQMLTIFGGPATNLEVRKTCVLQLLLTLADRSHCLASASQFGSGLELACGAPFVYRGVHCFSAADSRFAMLPWGNETRPLGHAVRNCSAIVGPT
jgi:hypothetical protein